MMGDIKVRENWRKYFIIIYTGQAFSILGSAAVQFAIIWWLTVQTESAIVLSIASIIGFIPNITIGPFAGVWIDRYNRRTVMILADGMIALSTMLLAIVFLFIEMPPVWFVYLILFLRGVGSAFHEPALQAAIPTLVPQEMLIKTGGWGNSISSISNMLGPVLGAILIENFPFSAVALVDILGAIVAITSLFFVKIPNVKQDDENKISLLYDMRMGFKEIRRNKPLVAIIVPIVFCYLIYMPVGSLYPLLVRVHFGGSAWHNGIAEFAFASGLLISSVFLGIWGKVKQRFYIISIAISTFGLVSTLSGILPSTAFYIFAFCAFVMGFSGTLINVPFITYVQETTPPQTLGKVLSLIMSLISLTMPVGLLVAGPVSEKVGVEIWFRYSGILQIIIGIGCIVITKKIHKMMVN